MIMITRKSIVEAYSEALDVPSEGYDPQDNLLVERIIDEALAEDPNLQEVDLGSATHNLRRLGEDLFTMAGILERDHANA